uniref:Uncharacterized protein n=1 Tax=Clastoptera arizonana TaxID=38151 RepID=A0A1B6E606_9HEMI
MSYVIVARTVVKHRLKCCGLLIVSVQATSCLAQIPLEKVYRCCVWALQRPRNRTGHKHPTFDKYFNNSIFNFYTIVSGIVKFDQISKKITKVIITRCDTTTLLPTSSRHSLTGFINGERRA